MADELTRGARIASTADAISQSFARELARVLRDADRALRPILREAIQGGRTATGVAVRGVALRRALRQALTTAGYDALVQSATVGAVERMADVVLATRIGRVGAGLIRPNPDRLRALAALGQSNLLQVGDDVAGALWRSLVQWLWTVRDVDDILADLDDVFGDEIANLRTLFDTQVSIYGRQIEALATAGQGGDQPYLYTGPVDALTRPWCLDRVGTVWTRDVIEAMDNRQLANPFITGGGYNCRHAWMAVQSPELVALANTGRVAPEFAVEVARAKETRARMRRERESRRAA